MIAPDAPLENLVAQEIGIQSQNVAKDQEAESRGKRFCTSSLPESNLLAGSSSWPHMCLIDFRHAHMSAPLAAHTLMVVPKHQTDFG